MISQIKILLTSTNFFTVYKFRLALIEELTLKGFKVIVIASADDMSKDSYRLLVEKGIKCIDIGPDRGSYSFSMFLKKILIYRQIIDLHKVDICVNFTLLSNVIGGISSLQKKIRFISVVTGLGGQYHNSFISKFITIILYRLIIKKSSQIWFVSKSDATEALKYIRYSEQKSYIVYGSGIKNQEICKINYSKSYKQKILYLGRIRVDKGTDDFLSLAKNLYNSNDQEFILMGKVDTKNKSLLRFLEDSIKRKYITFLNFNIGTQEVFKSSHVLVLCSKHEGMPTVLLEAMSNSLVPVSSNIPVSLELMEMGAKIYTYSPGNIDELERIIKYISNLPQKTINKILKNNFDFVNKYFNQKIIAKKQTALIETLV